MVESKNTVDFDKLKEILDLKDREYDKMERQSYRFIEPERAGFTEINLPGPVRTASSVERLQIVRRQTSEETLRKRKSVFVRNQVQIMVMEQQAKFVDKEREQITEEINNHEALITEELFQLVMERQKSVEPIDQKIVDEILELPQMKYAMKRMNEKKWLDPDFGVINPQKVDAILKGFDGIYEAKKEAKDTENEVNKVDQSVKKFEEYYNPHTYQTPTRLNPHGAPKVQLLPHQERLRQERIRQRNLSNMAKRIDREGGTRKNAVLKPVEVKDMITKLQNLALERQETLNQDIWNV